MMPPLSDSKLFNHPELDVSPIRFKRDTMNQKLLNLSDVHRSIMTKKETDIVNSNTENVQEESFWDNVGGFDTSQKDAMKAALGKEMSLIQGPPGTGKSFIGSKIVEIILKNKTLFSKKFETPILIICYTNSALDQFLEHLLSFTESIIRIGGRSKSSQLENHNLSNLKNYIRENQMRNQKSYEQEKEVLSNLYNLKTELNKIPYKEVISSRLLDEFSSLNSQLKRIRTNEEASICRKAEIIGLTVTGAAKKRALLDNLKPKIVIVEEAAEILESHLIGCLPDSCQHLVMIGDHLQLRPGMASFDLVISEPNCDMSLFERLVKKNTDFIRLNTQHRMAPAIADLISPIYPGLVNHDSVLRRAPLPGINRHVTFLNHSMGEEVYQDNTSSKSNQFEADMVAGFAQLFIKLGVRPTDITILVAYTGQLEIVRQIPGIKDIKSDTIDNYQGEENEVILLSLVRSGGSHGIGFLGIDNRVSVALSRARRCLFILGNLDKLCQHSEMWRKVGDILLSQGALHSQVDMTCETHGAVTTIKDKTDFLKSPEGGCIAVCGVTLKCNHCCNKICHPSHQRHACNQPCEKRCKNDHLCPKLCDDLCGVCEVPVEMTLPCGHRTSVPCNARSEDIICKYEIIAELECGHSIAVICGQENMVCDQQCQELLDCGHPCDLPCHGGGDHQDHCQHPCDRISRGCSFHHKCPGKCWEECEPCTLKITRPLPCSHEAEMDCSVSINEYECTKKCVKQLPCGHPCRALCYEPCSECKVWTECLLECGHTVTGQCSAPPPCTQQCEKILACNHNCKERCGAPCTTKCEELVSAGSLEGCSHGAMIPCFKAQMSTENEVVECIEKCGKILSCGHKCQGTCSTCSKTGIHAPCFEQCTRQLVCGHPCSGICGEFCPPCKQKCPLRCPHGPCKGRCGEECKPCKEKCVWNCIHKKCTKKCGSKCNRSLCEEQCSKTLQCGHKCGGYCGELCFCLTCSKTSPAPHQVRLTCGCIVTIEQVKTHNSDNLIRMFECPVCFKTIAYYPMFKEDILKKYSEVIRLADIFFTHNLKLSGRKEALLDQVEKEESLTQIRKVLKTVSKTPISSTNLSMLETIFALYKKFAEHADLTGVTQTLTSYRVFSTRKLEEIAQILKSKGNEIILKEIIDVKMFSYESRLWKMCKTCGDVFQNNCIKCDS